MLRSVHRVRSQPQSASAAPLLHHGHHGPGEGIPEEANEQHQWRIKSHQAEYKYDRDHDHEGYAAMKIQPLETVVRKVGDHHEADGRRQHSQDVFLTVTDITATAVAMSVMVETNDKITRYLRRLLLCTRWNK